jgi:secondary thiamine-phosphate synthase enzyme
MGGRGDGMRTLFVRAASCSPRVRENADPDARAELPGFLERIAPPADSPGMDRIAHRAQGPDDMQARIRAALLPGSPSIPVTGGRMAPGRWQGLHPVGHRARPRRRMAAAHVAPDRGAP